MSKSRVDDYETEIGKITKTHLGYEGHGILTCGLQMDFGGAGQMVGGYALDEPIKGHGGIVEDRYGTAFGMEWIRRAMRAGGVESWEELPGRTLYVLRSKESPGMKVLGLAPLPTEPGETFIFQELSDEFYPPKQPEK